MSFGPRNRPASFADSSIRFTLEHVESRDAGSGVWPIPSTFARRSGGIAVAFSEGMPKRFVYGLRSMTDRNRFYTGITTDVSARITWHNAGRCAHTAKHRPWELVVAIEFANEDRALAFERYLKSGSGRAFAKRHFEE